MARERIAGCGDTDPAFGGLCLARPGHAGCAIRGWAPGYTYAREGHPNADVLARKLDQLEGAHGGIVLGSGMAAVAAVLMGLTRAGDHVLGGDQLYGRSLRLMQDDLPRLGIADVAGGPDRCGCIPGRDPARDKADPAGSGVEPDAARGRYGAIIAGARARGVLVVVDNTFTTPRGYRPFDHGADIVLHSVTKMLAGHSDATLGYVAARDAGQRKAIYDFAVTVGFTPSPFDCWLAERGLYSFELRYDRAEANAAALADHIAGLPGVRRVLYPTRPDHPDHNRAAALLGARGGHMVSFEIEGGRAAANRLTQAAPHIAFAPDAGGYRHNAVAPGQFLAPGAGRRGTRGAWHNRRFFPRVGRGGGDRDALRRV